jgi:hypothetical protein
MNRLISILLFVGAFVTYILNDRLMITGDSLPASIWVFNLLENHSLTFNALADKPLFANGLNYYFSQHANGDWITNYPIGPAILTAPLYILFYIQFKLSHLGAPLGLLTPEFEMQRFSYERLAASILAAASVVVFFHVAKVRFKAPIALITAMVFGFCTTTWTASSQALWQHGPLNFVVLVSLWALLRPQPRILLAGICGGFLFGIRPTAIVYVLPLMLYVWSTTPRRLPLFASGMLACLPALVWNLYYFGYVLGGYSVISATGFHKLAYFPVAFPGILFSPSRGVLVYSPVLLFALPGCLYLIRNLTRRTWHRPIDALFLGLFVASLGIFLSYGFVACWWGGHSYGPRFLTDVLPAFCLMIAYWLEWLRQKWLKKFWRNSLIVIFGVTALFSMGVQFLGVALPVNGADWNGIPTGADLAERAWRWPDSQIVRNFQALRHEPKTKYLRSPGYVSRFNGAIMSIGDEQGRQLDHAQTLTIAASTIQGNSVFLRPQVMNRSEETWYGYQYGIRRGAIQVKASRFDGQDKLLSQSYFYLPNRCAPHQICETRGTLELLPRSLTGMPEKVLFELNLAGVEASPIATYKVALKIRT